MICPRVTREQLVGQLSASNLSRGDVVMVHAGMRKVGAIMGGPDVLIDAILHVLGPEGTMMMYLGAESPFDDVGRPRLFNAQDTEFILRHCPVFDKNKARANRSHGILAEFFRTTDGVICSDNPGCRMAAIGAKAKSLIENHPMNYGLGVDSPLEKLCRADGKLLLIGSDPDCVTLLHYSEAIAPIPNKEIVNIQVPLLVDGERTWVDIEEFDSSRGIIDWPDENLFATITTKFVETKQIPSFLIGEAQSYILDANELVKFAVPIMVKEALSAGGS